MIATASPFTGFQTNAKLKALSNEAYNGGVGGCGLGIGTGVGLELVFEDWELVIVD